MFVCAGEIEQFELAVPIGIGLIDATINLTKLCLEQRPDNIIFIGSAGSYGKYKIFDIVESSKAANIENSFFNANSYSPIDNIVSHETIQNKLIVNSSNYITTDSQLSDCYLSENIQIENMEFYAILKTAQKFDIPARGIFIITNYCDKNAHKDFIRNHSEAMKLLNNYLIT